MALQDVDGIRDLATQLAARARDGFAGEKPLAIWAMLREIQLSGPTVNGLALLANRREGVRQQFLQLAQDYGRMKDPSSSWSVITGGERELQRVLQSNSEANAAFGNVSAAELTSLDAWFRQRAQDFHRCASPRREFSADGSSAVSGERSESQGTRSWIMRDDDRSVEAWADFRLPFEPKADQRDYREQLKRAIARFQCPSLRFIEAQYMSRSLPGNCDVENVLFYNVGSGVFTDFVDDGLSFRYRPELGPPDPDGATREHYVQYRVPGSRKELVETCSGTAITKLADVCIKRLNSGSKPYEVWRDVQLHLDSLTSSFPETLVRGEFALDVDLRWPAAQPLNLAALIKPLFDGIVSAFHRPRSVDSRTIELAAAQIGADRATVERWLTRTPPAILSEESPVEPYRGSVRWNPDDARLRAGRVLVYRFDACDPVTLDIVLLRDA